MKPVVSKKIYRNLFCIMIACLLANIVEAQLCSDPKDTVYGLTVTTPPGQIVGINVNNAGAVAIGLPSTGASNTNGIGYSETKKLFYYFNKSGGSQQFVSYNPLTSALVVLAAPPASIAAADQIRSGAVTPDGTGYYTIDPLTTPHATFYYYSITSNTWTTISASWKDQLGNPVPDIDSLLSGDMAFDAYENLWMICSSKWEYALYELTTVPKVVTASLTVHTMIARTNNPAAMYAKTSITGVAFNSVGNLYAAYGTPGNALYQFVTPTAAGLTLIGPITNDYGGDLTSCSFPLVPLAILWHNFSATLHSGTGVELTWTATESKDVSGYQVEYSTDGQNWQTLAFVPKEDPGESVTSTYNYTHRQYVPGNNYYRLIQTSLSGGNNISSTQMINAATDDKISFGPNPAKDVIYVQTNSYNKYFAQVYDRSGGLVFSTTINQTGQAIRISQLANGVYILKLSSPSNKTTTSYQFIKW